MKTNVILFTLLTSSAFAQGWIEQPTTFWKDPAFQNAFMGSYGFRAEIEPRVTAKEREVMEKILALMGDEANSSKTHEMLLKEIKPTTSAVFDFTLANLFFQEDNLTNAVTYYTSAIEKFPTFQRAYKNLGLIQIPLGNFEQAIEPLTKSIELGALDGMTYGLLGFAYANTEQYLSAECAYRHAVVLQPKTLDWKLGLCRCLFKQQKYNDVIALCKELAKRDPQRADYPLLKANAYLGLKQPMRAAEIYELLDIAKKTPLSALYTLGDIYVNEGLLDQAAEVYTRALQRETTPDYAKHLRNVEVLVSRSAYPAAMRLLASLRGSAEKSANLSDDLRKRMLKIEARTLAAQGGASEVQTKILEEIVRLDPLDGDALILLGQCAAATNMEKAIFYYERAANIEAFESEAKLRHAQLLVKAGKYQDALPLLKRALELKPREDVQRYAEQVERAARRTS